MNRTNARAGWLLLFILTLPTSLSAHTVLSIHADQIIQPPSELKAGVCIEDVNHEIYGGLYSQMIFGESFGEPPPPGTQVSGMWSPVRRGSAIGTFALTQDSLIKNGTSQGMTFVSGEGEIGIENRGLNHWGMNFISGKPYQGSAWVRSESATELTAAFESGDGRRTYARQAITINPGGWKQIEFNLTPDFSDHHGRFALLLKKPGAIQVAYVFLQPGSWGRYADLPVRRDVVGGLLNQGVAVMRYGGSMVNSPNYRFKNMIGPRSTRPAYQGLWYKYSTNGFSVVDFLNLCEAMKIMGIPDLNINESPQDISDFIEYANGSVNSPWGKKRAEDGHLEPYHLTHLELGNEERVDAVYAAKFKTLARAIWAKDPDIILVVGDFGYNHNIIDPDHISGADSRITNLDGQRQILQFAHEMNHEVWFDVHVWSESLTPSNNLVVLPSYIDAIDKLADGVKHRVVVFELNANTHDQERALANAVTINTIRRDNRIPIVISANGLQPDGQNDNGWNQGLLFLNPEKVWLQPPGYVTQLQFRNHISNLVKIDMDSSAKTYLDVTAGLSQDKKSVILQVINIGNEENLTVDISGFKPTKSSAHVSELTAGLRDANTANHPDSVRPEESDWIIGNAGQMSRVLPGHSYTIFRFK